MWTKRSHFVKINQFSENKNFDKSCEIKIFKSPELDETYPPDFEKPELAESLEALSDEEKVVRDTLGNYRGAFENLHEVGW